ncbi:MAG: hypothetical protein IKN73_03530 [Alphaproteobacteria bacterium]|nr:hypothetical protein [Alphaproteobacteria bacterium]
MKIYDIYTKWIKLYNDASINMKHAKSFGDGILIEIAAQHPLQDGLLPNHEFKTRLDAGIELYKFLKQNNNVKIYVPGSKHQENGTIDLISLSESGLKYLINHGIPEQDIFANDANNEFMPYNGVYNSSDECFVSCELFKKHNFQELHLICSQNQIMRKILCYIKCGYLPIIHSVYCEKMYHNPIDEIFKNIPKLLKDDMIFEEQIKSKRRPIE